MDWIPPLLQGLATVLSAVVIYVVGQLLVKLAEPALALRALIGKIAGDLVMYANRDERIARDEERLKIFRRHASDLFQASAAVVGFDFFSGLTILPPKGDVEKAGKLLISFANAQLAKGAEIADYRPDQTMQEIRRLLNVTDLDKR
jgi:hypothetical protein